MIAARTHVKIIGTRCLEAFRAILGEVADFESGSIDVLILGPEPVSVDVLQHELASLTDRPGHAVPYVVLPAGHAELARSLSVPYVTYGLTPEAHVRVEHRRGYRFVETPLGSAPLPVQPHWDELAVAAAIAAALVLRVDLEDACSRLGGSLLAA